jgi:uncharacterized protein
MKIDISEASKNKGEAYAFTVSGKLDDGAIHYLNGRFVGDVVLEGECVAIDRVIEVDGVIKFRVACNCDLCNVPMEKDFVLDFSEDFHFGEAAYGEYAYKGNTVELDKAVEDAIMLELPRAVYCSPDCKGVCHKCGKNLNEGDCGCKND